jgi:hypothetical protein
MNLELLKIELGKPEYLELVTAEDYPGLVNILNNKPLIDNPEPQQVISKPVTIIDLWQQITPQEGLEIYKISNLKPDIDNAIATNNLNNLQILLAIASQIISAESTQKLQALLLQTIPDPNYKSQMQGESVAEKLGFLIGEAEIQSALNL